MQPPVFLETLISGLDSPRAAALLKLLRTGGAEDLPAWLSAQIAAIDTALSRQMDAILQHPAFQSTESAWRGLAYLLEETKTRLLPTAHSVGRIRSAPGKPGLRIRFLTARREEWEEDFEQGAVYIDRTNSERFDRTHFWNEVFAREFDTAGGEPFGLIVCDYAIGDKMAVKLAEDFSKAAMGGFCPVLFRAAPELFGAKDFSRMSRRAPEWRPELAADMEGFRRRPEASFTALLLPDMRLREPYRLDGGAAWPYRERLHRTNAADAGAGAAGRETALRGHAGWSYAASVMLTFAETGWVYSLDKRPDGAAPAQTPGNENNSENNGDTRARPMTAEVYFGTAAATSLSEMGCCAAHAERSGERIEFVRPATLFRMPGTSRTGNTGNAGNAGNPEWLPSGDSLPAVLAVSRIAHFLKTAARERTGTFSATTANIQTTLSGWLKDYVSDRDGDPARPLAKQEVSVTEADGGDPGRFHVRVRLWLKPVWGRRREGDFSFPFAVGGS